MAKLRRLVKKEPSRLFFRVWDVLRGSAVAVVLRTSGRSDAEGGGCDARGHHGESGERERGESGDKESVQDSSPSEIRSSDHQPLLHSLSRRACELGFVSVALLPLPLRALVTCRILFKNALYACWAEASISLSAPLPPFTNSSADNQFDSPPSLPLKTSSTCMHRCRGRLLSLAFTTVPPATHFPIPLTWPHFQRQLHSTRTSLATTTAKKSTPKPITMSNNSTPKRTSRRRSVSQDRESTSPHAKKPMFSIFQKGSNAPSAPADIAWKTHGSSFIVGQAFHPKSGSKVASFDLVSTVAERVKASIGEYPFAHGTHLTFIPPLTNLMQDSTLIKVNGKHKWPKNADDWVWWVPGVPAHLQKVADEG